VEGVWLGAKNRKFFEIFAKETVMRAFVNFFPRVSAVPVPDTVALCPSKPLTWLLMQLKKKESDEDDEVKGAGRSRGSKPGEITTKFFSPFYYG